MQFNKVEINGFRNLVSTSFTPSPSLNLIHGSNGSGKSSLLESLCYLATGNSFRTHRLTNIISHPNHCFTLYSEITVNSVLHRIGLKRCRDLNHQSRIDGRDLSRRSELVQLIPLQVLSPESMNLLLEGSEQRRNFIDWSLFHVEHSFHHHLAHYLRSLKQRNALLKLGNRGEVSHWNIQLVTHGEVIDSLRREYIEQLKPHLLLLLERLLPDIEVDLAYRSGWLKGATLEEALNGSIESDLKLKHTTVGPHRADFSIRSSNSKVTDILSRGQLKLVVIALKLAQLTLLSTQRGDTTPIILVDDLAAELDIEHRALLLDTISSHSAQLFITTPDISLIDTSRWDEKKVFHVEHGQVKEMV